MDTFIKAHSVKKLNWKLRNKHTAKLKCKLKLMLNGYELNDINAIRNAAERGAGESDSDLTCDDSDPDLSKFPQAPKLPSSLSPSMSSRKSRRDYPQQSGVGPNSQMMQTSKRFHKANLETVDENSCSQDSNEQSENDDLSLYSVHESDDQAFRACISKEESKNNNTLTSEQGLESHDSSLEESEEQSSNTHSDRIKESLDDTEQESLWYESDTHNANNTSMYLHHNSVNTSSSSCSEFDGNGYLATAILEKLNNQTNESADLSIFEMDTAPSSSGYIQINKSKKGAQSNVCDKNCGPSLLKIKMNKMCTKKDCIPYISVDASNDNLPDFLSSFRDYKFSTTKNFVPKIFHAKPGNSDFGIQKLSQVEISKCTSSLSATSLYNSNENYSAPVPEEPVEYNGTDEVMDVGTVDDEDLNTPEKVNLANIKFHHVKDGVVAVMRHPSQLLLHGKVKASSLCGTVDVMGYKLHGNYADIYAPKFSFAQTLRTVPIESSQYGLFSKLTALGISVLATEDIVVSLNEFDVVLHLERLEDKKLDFVEAEFASSEIFQMPQRSLANEQFPDVATKLSCSLFTDQPYKIFQENAVWPEVVKYGKVENSRGIVCGGKGTGKSTFLKYYTNKMVSEGPVVVIDLDPGQAEFTVAGNVSITLVTDPVIGPNFTHLREPKRMLNVGMINVLENVERYVAAVTDLLKHVTENDEYEHLPWIVNTMGMCNSLGLKVLTYIILLLQPTFLVQMDSDIQNKCFDIILTMQEIKRVYDEYYEEDVMFENIKFPEDFTFHYFMSSHAKLPRGEILNAKDKRYLCFLSYFGSTLSRRVDSLLAVRPFVVQLHSLRIATTCPVDEISINSIINGKIVALCEDNRTANSKTFYIGDNALVCHGQGLIRGIDLSTESVYIIAKRTENLSRVNVLLYCESHPELTLREAGLPTGTFVPYRTPLQPSNRRLLNTPKRRFNPLMLLKMKRNSTGPNRV